MTALRSGPAMAPTRPPSRTASHMPLQVVGARQAGHAQQRARVDLHLDRGQQLAQHPGEVVAQPGHAGELHRVGELVEDDPLQQLGLVGLEGLGRQPQVRRDEQQARRARGSSRAISYWPRTDRPMKPTMPPASTPTSIPPADCSGPLPSCCMTGSSVSFIVRQVRPRPRLAVDGLHRRRRLGGLDARVGGDAWIAVSAIASTSPFRVAFDALPPAGRTGVGHPAGEYRQSTIATRYRWRAGRGLRACGRPRPVSRPAQVQRCAERLLHAGNEDHPRSHGR